MSVSKVVDSVFEYRPIGYGASVFSGFAFKSSDLKGEGIPVIKIGNIQNRVVDYSNTQFFPEEKVTSRHEKYFLSDGDVLIAMTGQGSVGRVGKIRILDSKKILLNQRVGKFAVDNINLDNNYLYYIISSPLYESILFNAGIGSGQPNLSPQDILSVEIPYPDIKEQKAIAATLSVLDDMIELNNQINKTLEEMAQAIFKSWFVDFEPFKDGEFEESELGLIPKGWRVGVLEDIAFINTETINPQNYPETFFEHFSIPLFDEGKFSAFEKGEVIKSNKYVIDSSCMLFSKLNPQFKRVFRPFCKTSKAICSTEFMVYKAKKPIYNNYIYSTLCSGSFHQFVMQNVTGTTNSRQRAIPKNTLNFKMLIPDENALSSYNQIISGIFNIMQRIPEDNKLLSSIRDTILPKLMSGEIRVPVEEVV